MRLAREKANALIAQGKEVKFFCVGRKGYELLRRTFEKQIIEHVDLRSVRNTRLRECAADRGKDHRALRAGRVRYRDLVLLEIQIGDRADPDRLADHSAGIRDAKGEDANGADATYDYEPDELDILGELLPRNLAVQVFRALLENNASFYGSQMTAMDNATRNAGDMIRKQTITYNRTRQAMITKELIEIISGAEAL